MKEKYVSVLETLIEGSHMIMADIDDWIMIDYDIVKNQICSIFPLTDFETDHLFWCEKIIHIEQSYYFLYRNCMRIKECNTETMTIYNYGTDDQIGTDDDFKYRGACVHENKIIMLPGGLEETIWSFNVNDKSFHSHGKLKEIFNLDRKFAENEEIRFFCIFNEKYWFGIQKTKMVGYIDFSGELRGELMPALLEGTFDSILSPRYSGNYELAIFKDSLENLYIYKNGEISSLYLEAREAGGKIRNIILYKNQWIIMTDLFDGFLIFSLEGKFRKKILFPKDFKGMPENRRCDVMLANPVVEGENCYILPFSANGFIRFNMETEEMKWIPVVYDGEEVSWHLRKPQLVLEGADSFLQSWLEILVSDTNQQNFIKSVSFAGADEEAGLRIGDKIYEK